MTRLIVDLELTEATAMVKSAIAPEISEGIGAVLRKFCESPESSKARKALHAMPDGEWATLVDMLAIASAEAAINALGEVSE